MFGGWFGWYTFPPAQIRRHCPPLSERNGALGPLPRRSVLLWCSNYLPRGRALFLLTTDPSLLTTPPSHLRRRVPACYACTVPNDRPGIAMVSVFTTGGVPAMLFEELRQRRPVRSDALHPEMVCAMPRARSERIVR